MTIAPYHDHVLRLIKRCCLAGILNMVMISYQPESVGNCGTSPAKMLISIEMMIIGWGMKSKFDGGICRDVDDWNRGPSMWAFTRDVTSTKQWNFQTVGCFMVFQSWDPWLFVFATLRTRGDGQLHVPSSKVWGGPLWNQPKVAGKGFFCAVGGRFFSVSFWDEVHPPVDDADVVQQMVAVSVLQWLISCSNMTGMINPDPNARNGSRETIQWNAHIWWEHMGTTIWFPDVNDVSSSSPDGFTHFIIPANSRSVRWTPWASPCGGAASGTWDGRLN